MRISQQVAYNVSRAMTKSKFDAVELAKQAFRLLVRDAYTATYPDCIKEAFKKYPDYLDSKNEITINGNGFSFERVPLPNDETLTWVAQNTSQAALLEPDKELATKLKKMSRNVDKAEQQAKDLRKKIETALINLRTFSRIQENLPEAVPFLPKSTSQELMINFDGLRKEINTEPLPLVEEVA